MKVLYIGGDSLPTGHERRRVGDGGLHLLPQCQDAGADSHRWQGRQSRPEAAQQREPRPAALRGVSGGRQHHGALQPDVLRGGGRLPFL